MRRASRGAGSVVFTADCGRDDTQSGRFDRMAANHVLLTLGVCWAKPAINANSFVKTLSF
jgi:hypothetical protein